MLLLFMCKLDTWHVICHVFFQIKNYIHMLLIHVFIVKKIKWKLKSLYINVIKYNKNYVC